MTALYALGFILAFLLLLLLWPISLRFSYRDNVMRASVRYLLFKLDFSPEAMTRRAEKKARRAEKKKPKKRKEAEKAEAKEEKAALVTVKTVWELVKNSKKTIDIIRRHLILYKIKVRIVVGGEDAHQTAAAYGRLCAIAAAGLAVLGELIVVKKPAVSIRPDFLLERSEYDISLRLRILPWFLLSGAVRYIPLLWKPSRGKHKTGKEKIKGGKRHEPTASHR